VDEAAAHPRHRVQIRSALSLGGDEAADTAHERQSRSRAGCREVGWPPPETVAQPIGLLASTGWPWSLWRRPPDLSVLRGR
jgi:hypothetical protein